MRISVTCGATTDEEGSRSCAAIIDAWRQVQAGNVSGSDKLTEGNGDAALRPTPHPTDPVYPANSRGLA
jgi:hypothetical protein